MNDVSTTPTPSLDESGFGIKLNRTLVTVLLMIMAFFSCMLFFYVIRFPVVAGNSMYPSYNDGERLVVHYTKDVDRGDVIVAWSDKLDEYVVKRVIAVGGDDVRICGKDVFVNNDKLDEQYVFYESDIYDNISIKIPDKQVYILGDNRCNSIDSRVFGPLPCECIFGKVLFTLSD